MSYAEQGRSGCLFIPLYSLLIGTLYIVVFFAFWPQQVIRAPVGLVLLVFTYHDWQLKKRKKVKGCWTILVQKGIKFSCMAVCGVTPSQTPILFLILLLRIITIFVIIKRNVLHKHVPVYKGKLRHRQPVTWLCCLPSVIAQLQPKPEPKKSQKMQTFP